jgi:hypothetical protein
MANTTSILKTQVTKPPEIRTVVDQPVPVYQYPSNLLKEYFDYLQIDTFKYTSLTDYYTTAGVAFTTNTNGAAIPRAPGSTDTPINQTSNTLNGYVAGEGFGGRGIARERFLRGRTINTFQLPIPDSIQIDDAPMWNLEDLRTLGKFLPTLGNQLANDSTMSNAADTLKNLASGAIPEVILGLAEQTGVFSSKEAITQGFNGKILNPYYEMIFKGLQPRHFACRYKLIPRNFDEQLEIRNIIKQLRVNSLPNYSSQGNSDNAAQNTFSGLGDRWLTTPNIFELRFLSTETESKTLDFLPKFKPMVCTSVVTNYTPDGGWFSHAGGAPVAIELTLSFNEIEILVASEVAQDGY